MSGIKQMIAKRPVSIFPRASEKNGGEQEHHSYGFVSLEID
jgi:hypothetical protein